ncbi:DNA repair protein RecO [Legionella micdadei]|uniref:DNA repair protein RecO n=1 Tax=Legionella micdadei TaxID=451 RepID=A0A098GET9_LEGMI|nr:DNA repair protein RecO [Legionella micdadei]ARG99813.1 DNA repair protein RecO [Legionella micdadei]KTD28585.1 DNA repair protein RecO [Legionella micdadei]NSL19178.1 DNA repair protein RecO [Legionella micdadei]CEG60522.1 DNA repair protein recO [Legionella micdadei]SCX80576.1 DNA replication and repair protein RecO [Legionella micdadei]
MIEALDAWLLHKTPSGDSSARVSFFTREKGIINCLYKGGRTPKKQAFLQPFIPLWLSVDYKKDYHFVHKVEIQREIIALAGNSLFAGLYVNELVFYALRPMESCPELFKVYQDTLQGLAVLHDRVAIEVLLRRFEWALLFACGYGVSFTQEAHSVTPINAHQFYQFVPGEGFVLAGTGILGEYILALAQGQLNQLDVLKAAKFIMRQAVDHLLGGRELKSRKLYPRKELGT